MCGATLLAALALTACNKPGDEAVLPVNASASASIPHSPAVQAKATGAAACAPVPHLELSDRHSEDSFDKFGEDRGLLSRVEANFRQAYASACAEGLLRGKSLIDKRAARRDRIVLFNAEESNIASLYFHLPADGEGTQAQMLLEYHFRGPGRPDDVPSTEELHEAIYCAVHGASQAEEKEGRCLTD